jgi:hypothetical protein
VGIPAEVEDKRAGAADMSGKSTAASGNSKEVAMLGSSVHQGRSKSVGTFARAVEVDCNPTGP